MRLKVKEGVGGHRLQHSGHGLGLYYLKHRHVDTSSSLQVVAASSSWRPPTCDLLLLSSLLQCSSLNSSSISTKIQCSSLNPSSI